MGVFLLIGSLLFGLASPFLQKYPFISPVPVVSLNNGKFTVVRVESIEQQVRSILQKRAISFTSISQLDTDAVLVVLQHEEQVLLSTKKPLDEQLSSLQLILSRLTIEGKRFIKIDLRFDKPILVLK